MRGSWLPEGVGTIELDGRLLLVPRGGQELLVLNDTGRLVWESLAAGLSPGAVGEVLAEMFGIGHSQAQRDVDAIIAQWRAAGSAEASGRAEVQSTATAAAPSGGSVCAHTYALCGRVFRVEYGARLLERALHPLLAPLVSAEHEPQSVISLALRADGAYAIALDGCAKEDRRAPEEAVGVVINHLIDLSYPHARWLAILHAGAVVRGSRAILMPGVSGAGKSTLTAALVQAGCAYLSDDVVPLADTGHVMPVPLALCLKQGSWALLDDGLPALRRAWTVSWDGVPLRYLDLALHGVPSGQDGVPVSAIVFPRYVPGARLDAQELSPFATLERLLEARAWLSRQRADLDRLLEFLHATKAVELIYGALDDAVRFMHRQPLL